MSSILEEQPSVVAPVIPTVPKWKVWVPLALFAILWVDLARQLSFAWEASEQYAYGWFVPFLALALFWRRWVTRPGVSGHVVSNLAVTGLVVLLALALLPVRVVYEINPDWPVPAWLMTVIVVSLSLYAIFLMGGWRWVKHFAFPICFILVAVQWPYRIEHGLTQGLMRVVANLTVEVLGWFNIPAFQRGNLIEVSTGVVGIDEACSGIRSFQSTLMAALFLGELYVLNWPRRLGLLFGGVLLAFCFNVVRTLILTWHASAAGIAALEKWHDPAGLMIFLVSFASIWGVALVLSKQKQKAESRKQKKAPNDCTATGPLTTGPGTEEQRSGVFPRGFLVAIGCWAVCVLGATELWYRVHDVKDVGMFRWTVNLPETKPDFQKIEMAPRSIKLLAFDVAATGRWQEEGGYEWNAYFFRWRPNSIQSVIHSRLHRPDVCLPASGLRQVADEGIRYFKVGNLELPVRAYTFAAEGRILHVFFCQWEDGAEKQAGLRSSKQAGRLQAVLTGRRLLGQQTFELILTGYDTLERAEAEVRKQLPQLIQAEPVGASPIASTGKL
jgi:exosortase